MRCYWRPYISYKGHITKREVHRKIHAAIGEYDELLNLVKKQKLRWYGHIWRSSGSAKMILQGTVKGKEEVVDRRKDRKPILKSGQEWTLDKVERDCCKVICGAQMTFQDYGTE